MSQLQAEPVGSSAKAASATATTTTTAAAAAAANVNTAETPALLQRGPRGDDNEPECEEP